MKKAFTLVELLIVVVVIVTLMTITFRIGALGGDSSARNYTINRLQRLENCLSGYYAAYGSYPPVKLHGSRDYTLQVDAHGIQQVGKAGSQSQYNHSKGANSGSSGSSGSHVQNLEWASVESACRSQPLGMEFPYTRNMADYIKELSNLYRERANSNDSRYKAYRDREALKYGFEAIVDNSIISTKEDLSEWTDVQVFKFGLMSYLLPRYLVMMGGGTSMNMIYENQMQWRSNNRLPSRFDSGVPYRSWGEFNDDIRQDRWKVAVLPSQSACSRWIQNLEGAVSMQYDLTLYGVSLRRGDDDSALNVSSINIYSAGDSQSKGANYSQQYVLDGLTVKDGWNHEFYYYSPSPHQTYKLWSAGANGKTFPPWVTNEELKQMKASDQKTVQDWIGDDIVQMSN